MGMGLDFWRYVKTEKYLKKAEFYETLNFKAQLWSYDATTMVLTNKNKHWAWEWGLGYNRKWLLPTEGHKGQSFQYILLDTYLL